MREVTRNFLVGITSMAALVGLAVLLLLFGELDQFVESRYQVTLKINDAAGLHDGSEVLLDGVRVGTVSKAVLSSDPQYPVLVAMMIEQSVRIPESVSPHIDVALIAGGAVLQLQTSPPPPGSQLTYLSTDGSASITGRYRPYLAELTEQLDQRMQPLVKALEDFQRLADTYVTLGKNLNELVQPQTPQDLAKGEMPNLRTAVAKLNAAMDDAQAALSLAKQWLGDDQLRADAKGAVQKANVLIDRATAAVDRFTKLADGLGADAQDLVHRLMPVADELGATLEEIRRVMLAASTGKGTIAQLLNNPDLYNALNDSAQRLDAALIEARLLIEKIKSEGLPIRY